MIVLNILQWDLSTVTPYSILDNILRSLPMEPLFDPSSVRKHAETFLALAATEHLFSQKSPVTVAISCLGSAMRGLNSQGLEVMMSEVFLSCGQVQVVSLKNLFLVFFGKIIAKIAKFEEVINVQNQLCHLKMSQTVQK